MKKWMSAILMVSMLLSLLHTPAIPVQAGANKTSVVPAQADVAGTPAITAQVGSAQAAIVFKQTDNRKLLVGETYDFNTKNAKTGSKFQWKSSNTAVAAVNNKGVVTAVAKGTATITCTITKGKETTILTAEVSVRKASKKPAAKIEINNKTTSMAPGEKYNLNRTFTPAAASDATNWTSSNTSVATVNKDGVVTARKKGIVTITAMTLNKNVSDQVTIKISDTVTVSTQQQLKRALKVGKASTIVLDTKKELTFTIAKGDYQNQKLIVKAPNMTVHNYGLFQQITIDALKDQSWYEYAKGNILYVTTPTHLTIEKNAECTSIFDKKSLDPKELIKSRVTVNGTARIQVKTASEISIDGAAKELPKLSIEAKNVKINTKIPLELAAFYQPTLVLEAKAAAESKITAQNEATIPIVKGKFPVEVVIGDNSYIVNWNGVIESGIVPTTAITPFPSANEYVPSTPEPSKPIEPGYELGRAVAGYGSPQIDGTIDEVWNTANKLSPRHRLDDIEAQPTYRILWDEHAIYILAEVKDSNPSVISYNASSQDSIEIFVDENHDKTKQYGVDDLHLRVNYQNERTADNGGIDRLYSSAKMVSGGYLIESRIALREPLRNDQILGFELQLNDAKGAQRIGTATLFDTTSGAWDNTALFGELLLTGRPENAVEALNSYELLGAIDKANKLDRNEYQNTEVLEKAITDAKEAVKKAATQTELDKALSEFNQAIEGLQYTEEAAKIKRFQPVPNDYRTEVPSTSKIETLTYTTQHAGDGTMIDTKRLRVYVPAGYDQKDQTKKYNVYYLLHGGGESEVTIFGNAENGNSTELKNILDHMIANRDIEPMLVVTPTFYSTDKSNDITKFYKELVTDIIPLVEATYHTYAEPVMTEADLKASISTEKLTETRGHRAIGGFSMGSMATWNILVNAMEYFKYYTPFCGGQFAGGSVTPKEAATQIAKAVRDKGYQPTDLYVFAADGTKDITYVGMLPQMEQMKLETDVFVHHQDKTKGNLYFIEAEGGTHNWGWVNQYIYNILPDLFDREVEFVPNKEFSDIPEISLSEDTISDDMKGSIIKKEYSTSDSTNALENNKELLLYLPADHGKKASTKYNTLYLLHGALEDPSTIFDGTDSITGLTQILDVMIAEKIIEPMIVVMPTWKDISPEQFSKELKEKIIPLIETNYSTYANSASPSAIDREHRAIGGFAEGARIMWSVMEKGLDTFKYFIPLSGGSDSEIDFAELTKDYQPNDYYVFAATGSYDIAYHGMKKVLLNMIGTKDKFIYNKDLSKGNLCFLCLPGGTQSWQYANRYLYNILPDVFLQ